MEAEIQTAISVLQRRIRAKEDEINNLKRAVNDMCSDAGAEPLYPHTSASDASGDLSTLRSDQFYGQTIYGAARSFLEMRKTAGLGAASVNDIYAALRRGGYKFEAKDDENAKNGLRVSLRKQSTIFHRLPNGDYGLLSWYPKAKPPKDEDDADNGESDKEKPAAASSPKPARKKAAAKPSVPVSAAVATAPEDGSSAATAGAAET